jgi:hypothetical protein
MGRGGTHRRRRAHNLERDGRPHRVDQLTAARPPPHAARRGHGIAHRGPGGACGLAASRHALRRILLHGDPEPFALKPKPLTLNP